MQTQLIQQLDRFARTRDPGRRAGQAGFEVVRAGGEELVADVERRAASDAAEVPLAREDAPALVADVDEDVAAAVEGAEGEAFRRGGQLDHLLRHEDGLFELLPGEFPGVCGRGGFWDDADGALFAEDLGAQVHVGDALPQRGLGDVEEGLDVFLGPLSHFGQ